VKKIKLALVGADGKMGQEIRKLLRDSKHFQANFEASVALVTEGSCVDFKKSATSWAQISKSDVDVIVDFSSIEMTRKTLQVAVKMEIPFVSGVTGLTENDFKNMKAAARKTAVLWAPNMSLGFAVLKAALENFSALKNFDFQVIEAHHNKKKDKPSGTAIALQKVLEKNVRGPLPQPLSIRGGGIVGDHLVMAMSDEEVLEFSHRALQRSVFAKGALMAAEWISKRRNGLFEIEDVITNA
jgi:4-hydroxy-tetrahydrodipicolinate reductase